MSFKAWALRGGLTLRPPLFPWQRTGFSLLEDAIGVEEDPGAFAERLLAPSQPGRWTDSPPSP